MRRTAVQERVDSYSHEITRLSNVSDYAYHMMFDYPFQLCISPLADGADVRILQRLKSFLPRSESLDLTLCL